MEHYIKYEFQSRGAEIKLPPGAGIMNYGSGSESLPFYQRLEEIL
jgi:hypothetical protein